jgi:hypothetical protein
MLLAGWRNGSAFPSYGKCCLHETSVNQEKAVGSSPTLVDFLLHFLPSVLLLMLTLVSFLALSSLVGHDQ